GRFDAPNRQFGILYAARNVDGAFIEVFMRNPVAGQSRRVIDDQELGIRSVAVFSSAKLRLVDLTGAGLSKLGLDVSIVSTRRYDISRAWAEAFHAHPQRPDGILYRSRHDPEQTCLALFQRASGKLKLLASDKLAGKNGQRLLAPALVKYNVGVVASSRQGKPGRKQGRQRKSS
ncbi:MAG: RES family NAD+ phosphorylase, partial [Planctomycetota bacterium]